MTVDVSRGGLLVALAIFGVIIYELRTVLDFVGIELPLIPYMAGVFVLAGVTIWFITLKGGWRTDPEGDERRRSDAGAASTDERPLFATTDFAADRGSYAGVTQDTRMDETRVTVRCRDCALTATYDRLRDARTAVDDHESTTGHEGGGTSNRSMRAFSGRRRRGRVCGRPGARTRTLHSSTRNRRNLSRSRNTVGTAVRAVVRIVDELTTEPVSRLQYKYVLSIYLYWNNTQY